MKIEFVKMQGLGNDFILIENLNGEIKLSPEQIGHLCHRNFGVGADGLLTVERSDRADLKMRVFNSDGSEAEMCGNGIRCFALYARDRSLVSGKVFTVATLAGIIKPKINGKLVEVDMGQPVLEGPAIPVNVKGEVIDYPATFAGLNLRITCVSMGNPHCVVFRDALKEDDLKKLGSVIENDALFPRKTNVEFVQVHDSGEVTVNVWERGAGSTLACGTGACASVVAGVLNKKTKRKVLVHLAGGDLKIDWREDNHVYMTGPAEFVFEGEANIS